MNFLEIKWLKYYALGLIILAALIFSYHYLFSAPGSFPINSTITIKNGASLTAISGQLQSENIVRSKLALQFFVILFGGENHTVSGDYFFDTPIAVWKVAYRLVLGQHHLKVAKVTIPEGFDISEISNTLGKDLQNFDQNDFFSQAGPLQGYLFPDTYFFYLNQSPAEVIRLMNDNFNEKIAPYQEEIKNSGHTQSEIIIMASIIERESGSPDDKTTISGILWKRIAMGIPLEVDSDYNTYKQLGLPATPISNPGLDSILAALRPKTTPYLYYLHDKDGTAHYAATFAEHKLNIEKYLQ